MDYCTLTLPTAEENLALDEALLEGCEATGVEVLRIWEPRSVFVVLGYANAAEKEVDLEFCAGAGIPLLRRLSGGGTVVQAPGCVNYSLVVRIGREGALRSITGTNGYVMGRNAAALSKLTGRAVEVKGHTDLAIGGVKFSGNAQRRKKEALLFHGSLLLDADIGLIEKCLRMPSQEPDYRQKRSHGEFLMNLGVEVEAVERALREEWGAGDGDKAGVEAPERQEAEWQDGSGQGHLMRRVRELVEERYGRPSWNLRREGLRTI